jgi:hypothetical protein
VQKLQKSPQSPKDAKYHGKSCLLVKRSHLIKRCQLIITNARLAQARTNHHKHDIIIKISNVLGQSVNVLHEGGSIIPPKGYPILVKCHGIQSNPHILRRCNVQGWGLPSLSVAHLAISAMPKLIDATSKAQELLEGMPRRVKSSRLKRANTHHHGPGILCIVHNVLVTSMRMSSKGLCQGA